MRKSRLPYEEMVEEVLKNIDKFRLIGDRLSAYKLAAHFKIGLTQAYQLKYMVEERLKNEGC
jgi:hypothetical protein